MSKEEFRIEKDSMGEIKVPKNALYGAQTQRAIDNFPLSGLPMPRGFIRALGLIKAAAAKVNVDLKLLDLDKGKAIMDAAIDVANGLYDKEFPIDVFQTGSGTSSNMNANEVIARLASLRSNLNIHPNDDVNMCQSSNDVIPAAIHISASLAIHDDLMPSLTHLIKIIEKKAHDLSGIIKTGRTHLMDALPLTFGQELSAWATQIKQGLARIESTYARIHTLSLGGTAVGTGLNAHPEFANCMAVQLSEETLIAFKPHPNFFAALSSQDDMVELSGQLRVIAVSLTKISNDLRLMNSGPLSGLSEIYLPAIQPGSSIMPGKVNPVIPEAVCMAAAQVIGNDMTISVAGSAGNFQLNTMMPLIAYTILRSIQLIANSARLLADKAIAGFTVNEAHIQETLAQNPILVTALNSVIGYEKGAAIAKRAYQEKRAIFELAKEMTNLSEAELHRLLNPKTLTEGGLPQK